MTTKNWSLGATLTGTNLGSGAGTNSDITWINNGVSGSPQSRYDGQQTSNAHAWVAITPDNVVLDFGSAKSISGVTVWFIRGNVDTATTDPSDSTTSSALALPTSFTIQTWNGSSWDVQSTVTGNNKAKRALTFSPVSTQKVKFDFTADAGAGFVSVVEMECLETTSTNNVAFSGVGTYSPSISPRMAALAVSGIGSFSGHALIGGQAVGTMHGTGSTSFAGTIVKPAVAAFHGSGSTLWARPAVIGGFAGVGSITLPGVRAVCGAVSFAGRSKMKPLWYRVSSTNYALITANLTIGRSDYGSATGVGPDSPIASLKDGLYYGQETPYVVPDSLSSIEVQVFSNVSLIPKLDTIRIWSSTHDPFYDDEFIGGEGGFVGDSATEGIHVEIYTGPIGGVVPGNPQFTFTGPSHNRNIACDITFSPITNVCEINISGWNGSSRQPLKIGTTIYEIELLSTHKVYEQTEISEADATAPVIAVHALKFTSTADAAATLMMSRAVTLESNANATATDASKGKHTLTLESAANAAAVAIPVFAAKVVDVVASSNTLIPVRTMTMESSAAGTASAVAKIVHKETSSAAGVGTTTDGRVIAQTESSTANATSTLIGVRKVTATEVSTADGSNASTSKRTTDTEQESIANATSSFLGRAVQHATEVSTANARAFVRLPSWELPIFWVNTHTTAAATWSGLPFNSMIEVDGDFYAASVNGIYKLMAKEDDNGQPIESEVSWDLSNWGSDKKKRLGSVYVDAAAAGPFRFRVAGEQGTHDYQTHLASAEVSAQHRASLGKGFNSVYYRFGLLQDKYFSLNGLIVNMGDTTRRI